MKLSLLVFVCTFITQFCFSLASADLLKTSSKIHIGITGVPKSEAELITGNYSIDSKGFIRMPHIEKEKILASGIQEAALEARLAKIFKDKKIYANPVFVVTNLGRVEPPKPDVPDSWVHAGGDIKKPNKYAFRSGMTIADLIVEAGGLDTFGSKRRFHLKRNGKIVKFNLKYSPKARSTLLRGGDHVTIPRATLGNP